MYKDLHETCDTVDGKKNPPGGFLAITRYHSIGEVPGQVEKLPTSLPELPKPSRTPGKIQTTFGYFPTLYVITKETNFTFLTYPFFSTVSYGSIIQICWPDFGIQDFFRLEFRVLLEDARGDFCRIFGGILTRFSYSFEAFWEDFRLVLKGLFGQSLFLF